MAAAESPTTTTTTTTATASATPFRAVVFLRVSSGGYAKEKPSFITKESCFMNTLGAIALRGPQLSPTLLFVIADKCTDDLLDFLKAAIATAAPRKDLTVIVHRTEFGNGAASFREGLQSLFARADLDPNALVYCLEDDYLHARADALEALEAGLSVSHYATLYDHPDKYGVSLAVVPSSAGGPSGGPSGPLTTKLVDATPTNAFVAKIRPEFASGSERGTAVFLTRCGHFKRTNSTTMTFAARLSTLREDWSTIADFVSETHPHDFDMWLTLATVRRRVLVSAVPGSSTHGETRWLSPREVPGWDPIGLSAVRAAERVRRSMAATVAATTTTTTTTTTVVAATKDSSSVVVADLTIEAGPDRPREPPTCSGASPPDSAAESADLDDDPTRLGGLRRPIEEPPSARPQLDLDLDLELDRRDRAGSPRPPTAATSVEAKPAEADRRARGVDDDDVDEDDDCRRPRRLEPVEAAAADAAVEAAPSHVVHAHERAPDSASSQCTPVQSPSSAQGTHTQPSSDRWSEPESPF